MSRLKVMLRGAVISEIGLQKDKEYIGGRKEGSDIRLQAEKGISREHFKLKFTDGRWNLQAVSRFGDVFSMGQKIEQVFLDHGQSFQIPPYEFQILDVPESDITSPTGVAAQVNENEKTVIGVSPQVPYIKIVNSNGDIREMLRLEVGEVWAAGRDPSCQINIPDQRVSRRQFEIHKVNGNFTVIDLASVNGTFLNGSPISSTDPQTLKSGDVLTVLDNTMYFELHDPNFKYKIEKIEVPPMNYEQPEEIEDEPIQSFEENQFQNQERLPVDIPQIQQEQYNPQLDMSGGPFTGMPNNADPNQYYSFVPPAPPPPKKSALNPVSLIIILLLLGGGAYYYLGMDSGSENTTVSKAGDPSDPLSKLTPEQQTLVKESYTLAGQMMTQNKYDLALEKLGKIHALLKDGYLESMEMKNQAEQALQTIAQEQNDLEMAKRNEENAKKIIEIAKTCEKLLTPIVTTDQMRECLAPMSQIDVMAPDYIRLSAEAERIERDRIQKDAIAKSNAEQIQELADLFKKAEGVQGEGFAFKAISQYEDVIKSSLPDPKKLKEKAKERIAFIRQKISEKTSRSVSNADVLIQEGKLKQAVASLRDSLVYDPDNLKVKEKIESYREELRRQSRLLYQESIIDESYGLVDSTDTKQGAKEKWKKITEIDVDDGEYYKKAVIKLRRYGVM